MTSSPTGSPLVLALDIGTGSCKGAVYDRQGRLVAEASAGYSVQRPAPMWAEQNPEDWWVAVGQVCRALVQAVDAAHIVGVGLSGQVPTMVLVDADANPIAPAITWQDRRAEAEAAWLRETIGREQLQVWLGMDLPIDAGWPPARLLWWRRHQPELIERAHKVLLTKDFILARLTGHFYSDAWSAKGIVHLLTHDATADYYRALDLPPSIAPAIQAPTVVPGGVTETAAAFTGLRAGTPVVVGLSDALCGMAGTGAFHHAGTAFDQTGTSDIIGATGAGPTPNLLYVPPEVTGELSVLYGPTQAGGDSLTWFAEWTGHSIDTVLQAADAAPSGSSEIVFLPYLQGERTPLWDTAARGAFIGLMRSHTLGDGARAVMEGVAMSMRHILELTGFQTGSGRAVRLAGGSTRNATWNQIRADIMQSSIEVIEQQNAANLGAAMLAAVGAGLYATLGDAAAMVRIETTYAPNPALAAHYDRLYARFRALYPALKAITSSSL
jgi:xylulokinase